MLARLGCLAVVVVCALHGSALAAPCPTAGPDLVLTNTTCTMSGVYAFGTITLTNSTINVNPYTSGDKNLTGNLQLKANTITIDVNSKIVAKGSGYTTPLCGNGAGPTANAYRSG